MSQFLFATCDAEFLKSLVGEIVPIEGDASLLRLTEGALQPGEAARTWSVVHADALFGGMLDDFERSGDMMDTRLGRTLLQLLPRTDQVLAVYAGPPGEISIVATPTQFFAALTEQLPQAMNEVNVQHRRPPAEP